MSDRNVEVVRDVGYGHGTALRRRWGRVPRRHYTLRDL